MNASVTVLPPTLNPSRFVFWQPSDEKTLLVGIDKPRVALPQVLLPVNQADMEEDEPEDKAIGQGLYDYLLEFPDCPHNTIYADLLQQAFPHYLTDLAAQAVLLDSPEIDIAQTRRKLTGLKILALVEPENTGLLLQLSRGYYELALSFAALADCRRHLLQAMRYGQELLKVDPENAYGLHLLAEIDVLFGDFPGADQKWQRALGSSDDGVFRETVDERRNAYLGRPFVETNLVDDLESVQKALELYDAENFALALAILDRLEEEERFAAEMPSAEYFYLLGMCCSMNGEKERALSAMERALTHDETYEPAQQELASLREGSASNV